MGSQPAKCKSEARLDGKTAIITGCSSGVGLFTVLDFYLRGCRVIMANNNIERSIEAKRKIMEHTRGEMNKGEILIEKLDLSSLQSIKSFAHEIKTKRHEINLLINNSAIKMCPKDFTTDGFEFQFGANHLGHFLLTLLLLPKILTSAPARIINVTAEAHKLIQNVVWEDLNAEISYDPVQNYALSKLANVLFSTELARKLAGRDVTVYSVHPGNVEHELPECVTYLPGGRWLSQHSCFMYNISDEDGAQTIIYCAVEEKLQRESGLYYKNCRVAQSSSLARNEDIAAQMWNVSVEMLDLTYYDPFKPLSPTPTQKKRFFSYLKSRRSEEDTDSSSMI